MSGSSSTWTWAGGQHWGTGLYPTTQHPDPPATIAAAVNATSVASTTAANYTVVGPTEMERAEVLGLLAPQMWLAHRMAYSAIGITLGAALLIAVACRCCHIRKSAWLARGTINLCLIHLTTCHISPSLKPFPILAYLSPPPSHHLLSSLNSALARPSLHPTPHNASVCCSQQDMGLGINQPLARANAQITQLIKISHVCSLSAN